MFFKLLTVENKQNNVTNCAEKSYLNTFDHRTVHNLNMNLTINITEDERRELFNEYNEWDFTRTVLLRGVSKPIGTELLPIKP